MLNTIFRTSAIAITLTLSTATLFAQSASGTFLGVVKDATGAVAPNATITIVNEQTGFRRELTTNASGEYEAPYIPLGNYKLSARAQGFKTVERSGINLQVDQKERVDFTLQVGDVYAVMDTAEE